LNVRLRDLRKSRPHAQSPSAVAMGSSKWRYMTHTTIAARRRGTNRPKRRGM